MIRILYRHRSGTVVADLPQEQLPGAIKDPQSRIWIDIGAPTQEEQVQILADIFHFHPLAVDDAINDVHVPKIDNYGTYLYLVFHTFRLGGERMDIDTHEVDVFLGPNYLVTIHDEPSKSIETLWEPAFHRERGLARGPAMLLYELLDRQIDSYIPLVDEFEARVEELGDLIFRKSPPDDREILNEILTAKSSALRLRRILLPQREVLDRLAHIDCAAVPVESRIYFQDLYDHMVRLADLVDSMRDLVATTTTTHLTITSNRLNEIMKVLTVISTIFMPLSFVAGVYGMNFEYQPEFGWRYGYLMVWIIFLAIAGTMLYWFRRRGWL
jgi:magnesium transporter